MDTKLIGAAVVYLISAGAGVFANEAKQEFKAVDTRFLSTDAKQEWLAEMRKQLPIVQQKQGPFGLPQDLTTKKVEKQVVEQKAIEANAFPKAIAAMKVSIVMGDTFFSSGQEFKKGEVFSLERKGNRFTIRVVSVNAKQITFKNMDTEEQVIKQLNSLPLGLKPGTGFESVPGVTPANNKSTGTLKIDE